MFIVGQLKLLGAHCSTVSHSYAGGQWYDGNLHHPLKLLESHWDQQLCLPIQWEILIGPNLELCATTEANKTKSSRQGTY